MAGKIRHPYLTQKIISSTSASWPSIGNTFEVFEGKNGPTLRLEEAVNTLTIEHFVEEAEEQCTATGMRLASKIRQAVP